MALIKYKEVDMERINLTFTTQQISELRRLHKKTGIRKSEHVRRAVDEYILKLRKQENEDGTK